MYILNKIKYSNFVFFNGSECFVNTFFEELADTTNVHIILYNLVSTSHVYRLIVSDRKNEINCK